MLSVKQAAELLGVSLRTMYELAAPNGPIPCYRIGRAVRYDQSDLESYKKTCRCTSTRQRADGVLNLTASSTDSASGLLNYFRQAGLAPKSKTTNREKRPGSSRLRVIRASKED